MKHTQAIPKNLFEALCYEFLTGDCIHVFDQLKVPNKIYSSTKSDYSLVLEKMILKVSLL